MKLYHGGPLGHSASVLIALAEKGLPFKEQRIDLVAFEQHEDEHRERSPAGQVPVLATDGRLLTETFFILLYLDETHPAPPLGGADARARYLVQKWGKYVETHIAPNLALAGWAASGCTLDSTARDGLDRLPPERQALWRRAAEGFDKEEVATAREALAKAAGRLADDLATGPWLAGDAYTLADVIAFPPVARLERLGINLPDAVGAWLERVEARPAVRAALAPHGLDRGLATMGPERGRWG